MADKPRTAMADGKTSPKTIAAAVAPAVIGLMAVLVQWAVTGEFSKPETATAITALLTSLITGGLAWWLQPGETVVIPVDTTGQVNVGPATPV